MWTAIIDIFKFLLNIEHLMNIKKIVQNLLKKFEILFNQLNCITKSIIIISITFFICVLFPNSNKMIKAFGAQKLSIEKAHLDRMCLLMPNSVCLLANLYCDSFLDDDICIFTLYGSKISMTINENQSIEGDKRAGIFFSKKKDEVSYKFIYKLFNFQRPSPDCSQSEIKDLFTCNKKTLYYNINGDGNRGTGYSRELYNKLFQLESTTDMQSIAFHISKPIGEIETFNNRSIVIILNHNELTKSNYPGVEELLNNRMTINKDPEAVNYILSQQGFFNIAKFKYNFLEWIARMKITLNINPDNINRY